MFALVALAQANALEALVAPVSASVQLGRDGASERPRASSRRSPHRSGAPLAWADSDPLLPLIPLRPSTY